MTDPSSTPVPRRRITDRLSQRNLLIKRLEELRKADIALLDALGEGGVPVMCAGDNETVHIAGERIGQVIRPKTSVTLSVAEPDDFYPWMEDEFPTEVVWQVEMTSEEYLAYRSWAAQQDGPAATGTQQVRPAFWKVLVEAAQTGATHHPKTGEQVDIPGVELGRSNTSPTFRPDKGVNHRVLDRAVEAGTFSLADVAALLDLPATEPDGGAS